MSRMLDAEAQAQAVQMQRRYGMSSERAAAKIIRAMERATTVGF